MSKLLKALQENQNLEDRARWLRDNPGGPAREELAFFELCFSNIPLHKRRSFCRRLSTADKNNADAALYELVAHELFRRLHLKPEFGPKLAGASPGSVLTPDMTVVVGRQSYVVDVFLSNNPVCTIKTPAFLAPDVRSRVTYTVDRGDRAKKIRETLLGKHHKYSKTERPMILVVFLGDHWIAVHDVQTALYGAPLHDGWLEDKFPQGICSFRRDIAMTHDNPPPGGAMLPDESGDPGCRKLSAVIACDWFDTLNRDRPGRRLHCQVLRHWSPEVPMETGQFGEFEEVTWIADSSGHFKCSIGGLPGTAAAFQGPEELEFRKYDGRDPW